MNNIDISLEKASESDAASLFDMQKRAFLPLLKKYKDYDTSPANETIDRVVTRIKRPNGSFFKIIYKGTLVGGIRVVQKENTTQFWISPMFILPEYQGKGIAQKVLQLIEKLYPQASSWELATILQEVRNCYLYGKMGYIQTGVTKVINEQTTLVYYLKSVGS